MAAGYSDLQETVEGRLDGLEGLTPAYLRTLVYLLERVASLQSYCV